LHKNKYLIRLPSFLLLFKKGDNMSFESIKQIGAPIAAYVNNIMQKHVTEDIVFTVAAGVFGAFYDSNVFFGMMTAYWYPKLEKRYDLNTKIEQFVSSIAAQYLKPPVKKDDPIPVRKEDLREE